MTKSYFDYPSEPIGGNNPYQRCSSCKKSAPEINGELENHYMDCEWKIKMEMSKRKVTETEYTDAVQHYFTKYIRVHPEIRLGQYLCNHFLITDSEVFYQTDNEKAMMIFCDKYVDQ